MFYNWLTSELKFSPGFGVGHMRDTKTKGNVSLSQKKVQLFAQTEGNVSLFLTGIWVWGTPLELDINGVKTSVFYLDTEGFESVGKSNVYDDR